VLGYDYRVNSALMIVDPPPMWRASFGDSVPSAFHGRAAYYRWTGTRWMRITSVQALPRAH
jgi:hypothetical protein